MKKFIALILSLLFVLLTFSSCGEQPKEPTSPSSSEQASSTEKSTLEAVTVTFNKFESGIIEYSSATEFKLKKDNAYQSMTEEYLSIPAGTELSSDKEFVVYCYDENFKVSSTMMENAGLTVENYNPTFKTGKLIFTKTSVVRISVKGKLSDVKIEVSPSLKYLVAVGPKDTIAYNAEIKSVNNFLTQGTSNINYIYLTDIHYGSEVSDKNSDGKRDYDSTEEVAAKLDKLKIYLEKVVTIANNSPDIDFIVIGGDIVNGYETPDSPDYQANKKKNSSLTVGKHLILQHQQILSPLKKSKKPVFITAGNHDDNNGHSIYYGSKKAEWLVSDLDWDKGVFREFINVDVKRDSEYSYNGKSISKYYYYDLKKDGKTTRLIFLDFNDDRFSFDSKGEVTGQPNWGGYHDGQLNWLANVALQGKFDECIVFSHQSYINKEGSGIGKNGVDTLERIFKAYQSKSRLKLTTLTVDFSGRTSGNILLYHHGHQHKSERRFDYNTSFWEINTPMMVTQIDLVSVASEKTLIKKLESKEVSVLLRNGSESKTSQ